MEEYQTLQTVESSRPEQRIISHVELGWVKPDLFLIHHERSLEQQIKDNTCWKKKLFLDPQEKQEHSINGCSPTEGTKMDQITCQIRGLGTDQDDAWEPKTPSNDFWMISVRVKDSRGSSGRARYSCEYPGAFQGPDGENLRKTPGTSIRGREKAATIKHTQKNLPFAREAFHWLRFNQPVFKRGCG